MDYETKISMEKVYYFISNSDNKIYKTTDVRCNIENTINGVVINILQETEDGNEVIDVVSGYETLGDLMEVINGGGNDLE
jgi:hypothetical protein